MAYLTFTAAEEKSNACFKFIGSDTKPKATNLISNNVSLLNSGDCGNDTCSFYSGPSDATIMAFGESYESCGSIAYSGESCGSIAYSGGGESCGSVASSSVSSGASSCGGGCSYSC